MLYLVMSVVMSSRRRRTGEGKIPEYLVLLLVTQERSAVLAVAVRVVAALPAQVGRLRAEFVPRGGGGGGEGGEQGVLAEDEYYHAGQDQDYRHQHSDN